MNERDIFHAAIELTNATERSAYLEKVCAGNLSLKQHVEGMLQVYPQLGTFLESPAVDPEGAADRPVRAGRFQLGPELARGGMGVIHSAREEALGRDVAVKVLHQRYPVDSLVGQRFLDEARITAQLQHPGIPPVFEVGRLADERPYLAMKLIKGRTLEDLLKERPNPASDRGRFLAMFEQVCQAVGYAHSKHILHRDLKPANVMVGAFGEVQVMDWGLAKLLPPGGGAAHEATAGTETIGGTVIQTSRPSACGTLAGSMLGTPAFMAPEQAGGELDRLDERADVFGLGAVLCVILTGEPPYTTKSGEDVRLLAIRGKLADAEARLEHCGADPKLVELCRACLSVEREARPRDAGAVAATVAGYLAGVEERARQAETERAEAVVRDAEQRKRRRTVRVAGGVVAVVLLAGLSLSVWQMLRTIDAEGQAEKRGDDLAALNDTLCRAKYIADMNLAQHAWDANNLLRTRELLDLHRPSPGQTDLRGFEWHYLRRFFHRELRSVQAHTGRGWAVAFTPDGKRLVTSGLFKSSVLGRDSERGEIKLWDAATLRRLPLELKGPTDKVGRIALGRDGKLLAAGCNDKVARVWNLETGELFTLGGFAEEHESSWTTAVNLSADGKRLVCRFVDPLRTDKQRTVLSIWDLSTRKSIATIKKLPGAVGLPTFSPDGKYVASGLLAQGVKVWDAATGREAFSYKCPEGKFVFGIGFSLDGKRLAMGASDGIHIIDVATHQRLAVWPTASDSPRLAISPDGRRLATGSLEGFVELWDFAAGRLLDTFRGHTGFVEGLDFSPDGTRLASVSIDGSLRVWDTNAERVAISIAGPESQRFRDLSNDGRIAITGVREKSARIWSAATGELRAGPFEHQHMVLSIDLSPDGKRLIVADEGRNVKVWDVGKRTQLLSFKTPREVDPFGGAISHAAISPDGKWYALPEEGGSIELWNLETGVLSRTIKGFENLSLCRFSPDGSRLLAASEPGTIKVWDMTTGVETTLTTLNGMSIVNIRFSPDGKLLAVMGHNRFFSGEARLVDARSGHEVMLRGHKMAVLDMAFSPDGSRVATASSDKTVGIWDRESGQQILMLKGHTGSVTSVRFNSDGHRLITASSDRTVRVWDATPLPE
jgi:WD40 repeat protein